MLIFLIHHYVLLLLLLFYVIHHLRLLCAVVLNNILVKLKYEINQSPSRIGQVRILKTFDMFTSMMKLIFIHSNQAM